MYGYVRSIGARVGLTSGRLTLLVLILCFVIQCFLLGYLRCNLLWVLDLDYVSLGDFGFLVRLLCSFCFLLYLELLSGLI